MNGCVITSSNMNTQVTISWWSKINMKIHKFHISRWR